MSDPQPLSEALTRYFRIFEAHQYALRDFINRLSELDAPSYLAATGELRSTIARWQDKAIYLRMWGNSDSLNRHFVIVKDAVLYQEHAFALEYEFAVLREDWAMFAAVSGLPTFQDKYLWVRGLSLELRQAHENLFDASDLTFNYAIDPDTEAEKDIAILSKRLAEAEARLELWESQQDVTARQLAERLKIPKSTILRHVAQLREIRDFTPQIEANGTQVFTPQQVKILLGVLNMKRRQSKPEKN